MPTLEDLHSAFTELEQRADDYALPEFTPAYPKTMERDRVLAGVRPTG